MADLTLNFGFVSNAQTQTSRIRDIQATTNTFARMIVEDVAYNLADTAAGQAHRLLTKSVRETVDREMDNMAMTIGTSLAVTGSAKGPRGQMSLHGGLSDTAKARQWSATPWDRSSTKIQWGKRNANYLKWKSGHGFSQNWWQASETLHDYLSSKATYTHSFGPVRVIFDRARNQDRARARAGSVSNVTASGVSGPVTKTIELGKLRVIAMGNITPSDLPSLRTGDPKDAKPTGSDAGLARHLTNEGERMKLLRLAGKDSDIPNNRRFVLEPFISFYLTRAIPNAVWRRLERTPGMATEKKNQTGGRN